MSNAAKNIDILAIRYTYIIILIGQ